jgi:hypothetical protein
MNILADVRIAFFAALTTMTINISVMAHNDRNITHNNIPMEQLASLSIVELSKIKVKV